MDDLKAAAEATYSATAGSFDHPALGFRGRFGRSTVDRLGLNAGERVLDAARG